MAPQAPKVKVQHKNGTNISEIKTTSDFGIKRNVQGKNFFL